MEHHDVIIVGAGISGLATAHFLRKLGREDLVLLEGSGRPGGAIRTFAEDGYLAEWGPHGFLNNSEPTQELLAATGLDQAVQLAPLREFARYICLGGRLQALPQKPPELLFSPLLSIFQKARLLGDLFKRPVLTEQSVREWARHRFGSGVLPLVDAAITGTFAGDFGRLSMDAVMPGVRELEHTYGSVLKGLKRKKSAAASLRTLPAMQSFPQGMEHLPRTLAGQHVIHFHQKVEKIERSSADGRWQIQAATSWSANQLILALPVNPALALLSGLAPAPVERIAEAHLANVLLGFGPPAQLPRAFGFLAPESEDRFLMGAMFSSQMFAGRTPPGRILLEVLVGGRRHPERLEASDSEIIDRSLADLRTLLDLPADPEWARVLRTTDGIPQLEIGHGAVQAYVTKMEKDQPGLYTSGFGLEGIGINDVIRAARKLAERLVEGSPLPAEPARIKPVYF